MSRPPTGVISLHCNRLLLLLLLLRLYVFLLNSFNWNFAILVLLLFSFSSSIHIKLIFLSKYYIIFYKRWPVSIAIVILLLTWHFVPCAASDDALYQLRQIDKTTSSVIKRSKDQEEDAKRVVLTSINNIRFLVAHFASTLHLRRLALDFLLTWTLHNQVFGLV